MSYKLFLDDQRNPADVKWVELPLGPWVIVRNYAEFVKTIRTKGIPEFIAFDHDLADEHYRASMTNPDRHYNRYYTDGTFKEKTGYECAKWLADYCYQQGVKIPQHTIHTLNPIGCENIAKALGEPAPDVGKNLLIGT